MSQAKKNSLLIPFFLLIVTLIITIPLQIAKADLEAVHKNIYLGPDEVVADNLIRVGRTIEIEAQVEGDVMVAGGTVNIKGPVAGDVIALAGNIKISGPVGGNVRVAGGTVEILGKVDKNVNAFAGTIIIGENAEVGWGIILGGGNVEIRGPIQGNIKAMAGNLILASKVGGNADLRISKEGGVVLYSEAVIGGDLTYWAPEVADEKEGAQVQGKTVFHPLKIKPIKDQIFSFEKLFWKLTSLFSLLIIGMVIVSLIPKPLGVITQEMEKKGPKSLAWGLFYFTLTPIVSVLMALTLIGLPLALIIGTLYFIALYVSKVLAGLVFGEKILRYIRAKKSERPPLLPWKKKLIPSEEIKEKPVPIMGAMIIGVLIFFLLTQLPYTGWMISLLGILWGLGGLGQVVKRSIIPKEEKVKADL